MSLLDSVGRKCARQKIRCGIRRKNHVLARHQYFHRTSVSLFGFCEHLPASPARSNRRSCQAAVLDSRYCHGFGSDTGFLGLRIQQCHTFGANRLPVCGIFLVVAGIHRSIGHEYGSSYLETGIRRVCRQCRPARQFHKGLPVFGQIFDFQSSYGHRVFQCKFQYAKIVQAERNAKLNSFNFAWPRRSLSWRNSKIVQMRAEQSNLFEIVMPSAAYLGRSQFSCKREQRANLFGLCRVQPKMDEVKDSASRAQCKIELVQFCTTICFCVF